MDRQVHVRPGEARLGKVSNDLYPVNVIWTLDTSAYASGDLLANPVEIAGAALGALRVTELVAVVLHDEDDQGVALNLVFSTASTNLGAALNSAPDITDANARNVVGHLALATTDYVDLGGNKVATKTCNIPMLTGSAGASLYVGLVNATGTPTFTAAGVRATLWFRRH